MAGMQRGVVVPRLHGTLAANKAKLIATWRPDLLSRRSFVAVREEASIARAAERDAVVPSATSKRIAEIANPGVRRRT